MASRATILVGLFLCWGVWGMVGCASRPVVDEGSSQRLVGPEPSAAGEGETLRESDGVAQDEPASRSIFEECIELGESTEGRLIEAYILGNGPEVTLVLATIHGNEPAGTPLCFYLLDHLREQPELLADRRIIIVPVANPDGYAAGTRYNVNGIDLNRNFPAPNRTRRTAHGPEALSEIESLHIHNLILEYAPTRIISLHQPLACIDYDGPIESLAHRLAELSGLPVKKLGGLPGSLGSFASMELGIGIITFELPRNAHRRSAQELWQHYGDAMIESITFREGAVLTAEVEPRMNAN